RAADPLSLRPERSAPVLPAHVRIDRAATDRPRHAARVARDGSEARPRTLLGLPPGSPPDFSLSQFHTRLRPVSQRLEGRPWKRCSPSSPSRCSRLPAWLPCLALPDGSSGGAP